MFKSDVLLVGGRLPETLVNKGVWVSSIKFILSTNDSKFAPRHPWQHTKIKICHAAVGGVTNGTFNIFCQLNAPFPINHCQFVPSGHTRQDLRWILKSNEEGKSIPAPTVDDTHEETATGVNYHGKGVITRNSLLPFNFPSVLVRTQYQYNRWVMRRLTVFERLLAHDVSERIIRSLPNKDDQQWLLESVQVPLKVMQSMIEHIVSLCRNHICLTRKKRTRDTDNEKESDHVNKRARVMESRGTIGQVSVVPMSFDDDPLLTKQSENHNITATKSDDAKVREDLWNNVLRSKLHPSLQNRDLDPMFNTLRGALLCKWRSLVRKSYFKWQSNELSNGRYIDEEVKEDVRDCLRKACSTSWWLWEDGSRPFFWRWPTDYLPMVRDGVPVWFVSPVKKWIRLQKSSKNGNTMELIRNKLTTIITKGYVESGSIDSLMPFFDVPKGHEDIRMVYDGSKSGLNDCIWAPWFPLPTAECLVRSLEPGYCMADNDVGEMFHNFVLHKDLRRYCGLDMSLYFKGDPTVQYTNGKLWLRWNRLAMGLRSSPYNAVQGMMIAKEIILGDPNNMANVFRWSTVQVNLPGSCTYDPSKSWISKVRSDGMVAADVFIYVDDIRTSAPTKSEAWDAAQRTSTILGFLGLQDAARKRREPGQETGAWTGTVVWTSNDRIVMLTTQEKWMKAKNHIRWISDNLSNPKGLDTKVMLSIRGFLVYVARTYSSMVPYLKGIHATIDSWRPGRNADGWKYTKNALKETTVDFDLDHQMIFDEGSDPPSFVQPVPRLIGDIKCLMNLTESEHPPTRQMRMGKNARVMYGFGDASKQGFGASLELSDHSIFWRSGAFTTIVQEQSSNYRELLNLVEIIEDAFAKGLLDNCEVFIFTDNSTAEAAYFKGTSSSEMLFYLVLRLRKIEMSGRCILHMIHIAGTRMIWQGTDGLSRGDRNTGVMAGDSMLMFLPLHLSALERNPQLSTWITSWGDAGADLDTPLRFLEVADWYTSLVEVATYVWLPPPALADVAAELMAQSIHKRPQSAHVFICPRLMTARWIRLAGKATDIVWRIPTDQNLGSTVGFQNLNMIQNVCKHCSIVIPPGRGLCCANSLYGRELWPPCKGFWCHGCYRLEDDGTFPIRRPSDEDGFAIVVEKDRDRFLIGREGDHLLTTFQCDLCHFRNLKGHSPLDDGTNENLLTFIRRANLDALWARESGTVKNTWREIRVLGAKATYLGLDVNSILPKMGPFEVKDNQGMGLAVCILLRSLDSGKNERTVQFSTTQKLKSSFANVWRASIHGSDGAVVVRDTTKLFHSTCPSHGEWFERFTKGMHERMGDKVQQDLGISIEQMHALMQQYERRWEQAGMDRLKLKVVLFPALFSIIAFCCALRGEELPLMRLFETRVHLEESLNHPTMPHVIVALLGRMKNEVSENHHIMPIVVTTATGLEPGKWIKRMVQWYEEGGITNGWVFRKERNENEKARASDYEWDILVELENIQRDMPGVIGVGVNVFEEYGVSRSFRRGSDAHALNQGVSTIDIEINNRWRSIDNAGGRAPRLRMIHHYSDLRQLLKSRLRYSAPL